MGLKRVLPSRGIGVGGGAAGGGAEADTGAQVIPEPGSLIGDLLSMDLGAPAGMPGAAPMGNVDLLGGGLDDLVGLGGGGAAPAAAKPVSDAVSRLLFSHKALGVFSLFRMFAG